MADQLIEQFMNAALFYQILPNLFYCQLRNRVRCIARSQIPLNKHIARAGDVLMIFSAILFFDGDCFF